MMINNIFKNKVSKYTAYIILTNILFILSYKIGGTIAVKNEYLFRRWLDILYIGNVMTLIILGAIFINIILSSKLYSKIKSGITKNALKTISTTIMVIIVIVCCLGGLFAFSFTYPEHIINKQGKKIIAKVGPSFLHTTVNFYEPINIFLMKGSIIESETYKGGYDRYK